MYAQLGYFKLTFQIKLISRPQLYFEYWYLKVEGLLKTCFFMRVYNFAILHAPREKLNYLIYPISLNNMIFFRTNTMLIKNKFKIITEYLLIRQNT